VGDRQPIFNVPGVVLALLAIMILVHLAIQYLPEDDMLWWLTALAFVPARYSEQGAGLAGGQIAQYTSFITHQFVHGDIVHLSINGAWLLAFGTPLARRLGWLRFLVLTLCCGIAGALLFLSFHAGLMAPVIGASGAIAGLMGAVLRFLFPAIDQHQGVLLRENPAAIPAMPLRVALRDRRVIGASLAFVALNLLAIFGLGSMTDAGAIAWEAHLGGYFFGLLCFGMFDVAARQASPTPPQTPSYSA
jgi:membrane associated rhomboid family serine protease